MILGSPGGGWSFIVPFLTARNIGPESLVAGKTRQSIYTQTSVLPSSTFIKPNLAPRFTLSTYLIYIAILY